MREPMLLDPTNRDDYDIMSALRGPDARSAAASDAKLITTGVIRYLAGMRADNPLFGVIVKTPMEAKKMWGVWGSPWCEDVVAFMTAETHFTSHIKGAFNALIARNVEGAWEYYSWLREIKVLS